MSFFDTLWGNHPLIAGEFLPCSTNGKSNFQNQCAIRMGVCLQKSGIDTTKWNIRRCWYHPKQDAHFLSAQELAHALSNILIPGVLPARIFSGNEVFDKIRLQNGIIFFENYYGPTMQGDHIDLWNGRRLTDWLTWARINIRVGSIGLHNLGIGSDFQRSQSVWFWTVV